MNKNSTETVAVGALSHSVDPALIETKGELYGTMSWNTNRRIAMEVSIQGYKQPFKIPLDWLDRGGNNTWAYIYYLLHLFVNEEGSLVDTTTREGIELVMEEPATAGQYLFRPRQGE